jgi:hypothetical protein
MSPRQDAQPEQDGYVAYDMNQFPSEHDEHAPIFMQMEDVELETTDSSAHELGTFEPSLYHRALSTSNYGRVLLSTNSVPSTQLLMLRNRKIVPHGLHPPILTLFASS